MTKFLRSLLENCTKCCKSVQFYLHANCSFVCFLFKVETRDHSLRKASTSNFLLSNPSKFRRNRESLDETIIAITIQILLTTSSSHLRLSTASLAGQRRLELRKRKPRITVKDCCEDLALPSCVEKSSAGKK